jgi:RNA-directed DNA polymerase
MRKYQEVREIICDFLAIKGLELSPEKTVITHINDGFDFRGWNFRKYKGKLLIKPSQKSIKSITWGKPSVGVTKCQLSE